MKKISTAICQKTPLSSILPLRAGFQGGAYVKLKTYGLPFQYLLADGGFGSGENYALLEESKLKGFISLPGSYRPIREGFHYDAIENAYVCRNEKLLYYHSIKMDKGFANHYYHARVNRTDDATASGPFVVYVR